MIRTIFFDFGNVVAFFDHMRALVQIEPFADHPAAVLYKTLYNSEVEHAYERGEITTAEYFAAIRKSGNLRRSPEHFLAAYVDIFTGNDAVLSLIPALARKYRINLASNTNEAHAGHFRQQFAEPLSHFHTLVVSNEARARKPTQPFFAHCQQFANCEPAEVLFIDDLAENVAAARTFGWQGIVYQRDLNLREELRKFGVVVETV